MCVSVGIGSERPLRYLFLDLNAYFASVEQQMQPELRGKPVVVAPVLSDSSCAIAASYEAKAFGIQTGTKIGKARQMCPGLRVVVGRHSLYTLFHKRIVAAVNRVLPVEATLSVDEMYCRLLGEERSPARAMELARRIKRSIRERVGEVLTCSVGIAPNVFIAKTATDMQKPDGLVVITAEELPERLQSLPLTAFTGINRKMAARLAAGGIFSTDRLLAASPSELRNAFASVIGERWWYLLRGYELPDKPTKRRSLGHSHVLAPELRTEDGVRQVLLRLLHKAGARLRKEGLLTSKISVSVFGKKSWNAATRIPPCCDSATLTHRLVDLWLERDFEGPVQVAVTFSELSPYESFTPSLFDRALERSQMAHAVDRLNAKFGKNSVFLAGIKGAEDSAPERVAFSKKELFSEGRGDHHEWDYLLGEDEDTSVVAEKSYRFGNLV